MKTLHFNKSTVLTTVFAVTMSIVIATQSTVASVSAQVAADNTKKQMDSLIQSINSEITRRQTVLGQAAQTGTSGNSSSSSSQCNSKDVPASITSSTKTETTQASSSLQSLQDSLKNITSLGGAQQTAKQTDDAYQQFQVTATKASIVKDMCTQSDAKQQLQSLVDQAKQQMASNTASGKSNGNAEEQTKLIQQLITAITAIFASVVALILALVAGDYAAAMEIFGTILGQLAMVGNILVQAIASMLQINISLGVNPSS
jgi:hypothetical protein